MSRSTLYRRINGASHHRSSVRKGTFAAEFSVRV